MHYNAIMLTCFKVSIFKNPVEVDVRFGPFTCIAGANGVGKSNLFDAIKFLGLAARGTLKDAADPEYPAGPDNPLHQVIVVTHSPEFVKLVPDDALLLARTRDAALADGAHYARAEFVPLAGTWRVSADTPPAETASRADLLAYLDPFRLSE